MIRAFRLLLLTFLPTLRERFRDGPARPTWSFLFQWTVRYLRRDWEETAHWPLAEQRAAVALKPYPSPSLKKVTLRDEVIAGVPVRRFIPPSAGATRIVFFHGGSYIYCSTRHSHGELCAALAVATGLEVIGVEYRLAPEHQWPAQLDDATAVCNALEGSLVFAGDSAGGHLAVKTTQTCARKPVALVLLSPWVDFEMPGASFTTNDAFDFGTREVLLRQAKGLAGDRPLAELALDASGKLPPTFVSLGGAEAPRDDILRFVEALRTAKVEVTVDIAPDMPHDATLFAAFHPQGRAALEATVAFIRGAAVA